MAWLYLQGHSGPVTGLAYAPIPDGGFLLASTSGDGSVRVWECLCARQPRPAEGQAGQEAPSTSALAALAQDRWQLRQEITVPNQIQHAVAFTQMPSRADQCGLLNAYEHLPFRGRAIYALLAP